MSKPFDVFRKRKDGTLKLIDTVFFTDYTVNEAKESLVNHDNYSQDIIVEDSHGEQSEH